MKDIVLRRPVISVTTILCCSLLFGCGGGGGTTSGTTPPNPTPVVTLTPTPVTPSAPIVSYDVAFDFDRDRTFRSVGASLSVARSKATGLLQIEAAIQPNDAAILIDYASASQRISVRYEGEQSTVLGAPSVRQSNQIGWTQGLTASTRGEVVAFAREPSYQYVLSSVFSSTTDEAPPGSFEEKRRLMLAGAATIASDIPATGVALFTPILTTFAQGPDRPRSYITSSGALFRVDFAARTFTATIPYSENGYPSSVVPEMGTLIFTGTLNNLTNELSGAITSADSTWSGPFTGRLFGPAGIEAGILFTIYRASDGARGVGELLGRR